MNNSQALNYASAQQQQMPAQTANSSSTKRKLEDDSSEQLVKAKRPHFLENKACQLIKEEIDEKNQLLQQLMPVVTYVSPDYKPSPNAIANFANSSMDTTSSASFGMITPPTEQQQLPSQMQEAVNNADVMMVDDDYTDEDESLQTPSYMNCYSSYITTDIGVDLDNGGYTGQLERGWSEMFNEMN